MSTRALAATCALLALAACSDSNDEPAPPPGGGGAIGATHDDVMLLDVHGQPIAVGETTPYSPRQTCGACHDVDDIANGYHFQQGRTDANGDVVVASDYFGDGRSYILSPGMYGKW